MFCDKFFYSTDCFWQGLFEQEPKEMAQLDVAEVRRKVKGKYHNPFDSLDDEAPTTPTKKQLFPSTNPFDDEEASQALTSRAPAQIASSHEVLNTNPFDTDEPTSNPPQGLPKSSSHDTLKKLEAQRTESKDHAHFINHKTRYSFHSHKEKVSSSHLKSSTGDGPRFPPVFKKSSMGSMDFRELYGQDHGQDEDSKPQQKGTRYEKLFVDEDADFVSAQKAKDLFGFEDGRFESFEKGNGSFGLVEVGFASIEKTHHLCGNDDLRAENAHKTREDSVFKDTDTALSQKHKDIFGNNKEEDHEDSEPTAPSTDLYVNKALADLEDYALEKSQDTTASIMNSLKIAEDTRGVAGTTLETLHYQGAQIERTHEKAIKLDQHLQVGEKLLNSLGGIFSKSWKPKKSHKITGPMIGKAETSKRRGNLADRAALGLTEGLNYAETKATETSKRRGNLADRAGLGLTERLNDADTKATETSKRRGNLANRAALGLEEGPNYAETKATAAPSVQQEPANFQSRLEMERKTQDDALSDLGNVVGQLKEMSSEMNTEAVRQLEGLDHLHDDVHELVSRVRQSNVRGQKLLRR